MRILLDTQCWLWMLSAPERLSNSSRRLMVDRANRLYLSAASAWEISIKYGLGKLRLPGRPSEVIPDLMSETAVDGLPVLHSHALRVADLPAHHRDPFDRVLVAQAQLEDLPILTADPQLEPYDVEILRA